MVKTIHLQGSTHDSTILIGERLQHASRYVSSAKSVILTDSHVRERHGHRFPPFRSVQIGSGEAFKTLRTVEAVYDQLVQLKADRSTFLLGIGGGVVCDITGFVASTYMRGIRFGYVATTLLAQVDASVGGKNGVNFSGYKNMVGVFNQPEFVICDLSLLQTLPRKEISCGFAEIIKHAAIADADMLSYLEANHGSALDLETNVLETLVYNSVKIKAAVVGKDEKEKGERRKLNFGHTFGHAIEKTTGISHGEAVSIGMVIAAGISEKKGLLAKKDVARLANLLKQYQLPVHFQIARKAVWDALQKDKKRESGQIHFVMLKGLGDAIVETLALEELRIYLDQL